MTPRRRASFDAGDDGDAPATAGPAQTYPLPPAMLQDLRNRERAFGAPAGALAPQRVTAPADRVADAEEAPLFALERQAGQASRWRKPRCRC